MMHTRRPLFPHQTKALADLKAALRKADNRLVVSMPTGAGKTRFAAEVILKTLKARKRACFIVPTIELTNQTYDYLIAEGVPPSKIGVQRANDARTNPSAPVQVCSAPTLGRRQTLPPANVYFVDECHIKSEFVDDAVKAGGSIFIGLTATPWRKYLGDIYGGLLTVTTIGDLVEEGFLSPYRVFMRPGADLSKVRVTGDDYNKRELSEAMKGAKRVTADIVENWRKNGEDRPTFCFCVSKDHAATVRRSFLKAGIVAGYVDDETPATERAKLKEDFHSGKVKVICNVGVLTTGIDWDVRCIIFARPTKSKILFVQIIGRGLRPAKGKDDCLVFDHTDAHVVHGFVSDIRAKHLHKRADRDEIFEKRETPTKACPECGEVTYLFAKNCSGCGYRFSKESFVWDPSLILHEITNKWGVRGLHLAGRVWKWQTRNKHDKIKLSLGVDEGLARQAAKACNSAIYRGASSEELRRIVEELLNRGNRFGARGLSKSHGKFCWSRKVSGKHFDCALGRDEILATRVAEACNNALDKGCSLAEIRQIVRDMRGVEDDPRALGVVTVGDRYRWVRTRHGRKFRLSLGSDRPSAVKAAGVAGEMLTHGRDIEEIRSAVRKIIGTPTPIKKETKKINKKPSRYGVPGLHRNDRGKWSWQRVIEGETFFLYLGSDESAARNLARRCNDMLTCGARPAEIRALRPGVNRRAPRAPMTGMFLDKAGRKSQGWRWSRVRSGTKMRVRLSIDERERPRF
jgi:DNA repair protein RadD